MPTSRHFILLFWANYSIHRIRFSTSLRIDLLTSSGAVAFVINPRFHANAIVRNTDASGHGSWGPEERHGPFVFQKGAPFELIITAEYDKYRVRITFSNNK